MSRFFWIIAAGLILGGCAKPLVILPDNVGDQGLLVAKVASPDMGDVREGDPVISGRKFLSGMRKGYVVVPLHPGEYTFQALNTLAGSNSFSTPYGTYTTTHSWSFPVGRTFTIEQGKATNLGLLVFLSGQAGTSRYYLLAFDNSAEMATFLQETHPKLYRSLKDPTPIATGPFVDPGKISELRKVIALRVLKQRGRLEPDQGYIAGPAGTLARVKRNKAGELVDLVMLDTGTFADLSVCSTGPDRAACLKSTTEYLLVQGESVRTLKIPEGVTANSLHVFRDRLALVDNSLNIYDSRDGGRSWAKYSGVAWKEALGYEYYRPDQKNRFSFHNGKDGYYIYSPSMAAAKAPLMYYDYATAAYRNLMLPAGVERVEIVRETDAGLFIGPTHTELAKGKIHLLPAGSSSWEVRETPEAGCKDFAATDSSGREIQVLCKRENAWKSTDGGMSWQRMFKIDSLFNGGTGQHDDGNVLFADPPAAGRRAVRADPAGLCDDAADQLRVQTGR